MTIVSIDQAKKALGSQLRALRRRRGISARELAALAGWHESKCSKIENGKSMPSEADIRLWARLCHAADQADDLISAAAGIKDMYVQWRHMEVPGLRSAQNKVLPVWENTSAFQAYSHSLIPGPLQTREYTRTVLTSIKVRRSLVVDDVDAAVDARMRKQELLHDSNRTFRILIEECVLRNRIGGPDVAVRQMARLVDVSTLPNIELGIIPENGDTVVRDQMWPVEDFWIFDHKMVNVELVAAYMTFTTEPEVRLYEQAFSELSELAVFGKEARSLIATALKDTAGG
ncbi:Predicted transcriptional regulators [Streptomyces sp. Ncost-T6T-1]|uniref:helix-turn-helix domain-containing protein n=1 Tax=Streptomyces sp. Ncost-T6T-1 TaxID=1100828 RepID=UPI000804F8FF|nr:helix-turn-helix transcriptional regulator [Streptomyces sp. Ncost-T6T-1]SBV00610.1 Predicted transcriptional regulators [Streptomyces sp. Ncost-T6T-1]